MSIIILEGVLFAVLIATMIALLVFLVRHFTPVGTRLRQTKNRKRIERAADLTCVMHGPHAEQDLVRLASGESMCPECYKEAIHGRFD